MSRQVMDRHQRSPGNVRYAPPMPRRARGLRAPYSSHLARADAKSMRSPRNDIPSGPKPLELRRSHRHSAICPNNPMPRDIRVIHCEDAPNGSRGAWIDIAVRADQPTGNRANPRDDRRGVGPGRGSTIRGRIDLHRIAGA